MAVLLSFTEHKPAAALPYAEAGLKNADDFSIYRYKCPANTSVPAYRRVPENNIHSFILSQRREDFVSFCCFLEFLFDMKHLASGLVLNQEGS